MVDIVCQNNIHWALHDHQLSTGNAETEFIQYERKEKKVAASIQFMICKIERSGFIKEMQ